MQGYNGSQLWDTAFSVQAIISTKLIDSFGTTLKKAHDFVKDSQVLCVFKLLLYVPEMHIYLCLFTIDNRGFYYWFIITDPAGLSWGS